MYSMPFSITCSTQSNTTELGPSTFKVLEYVYWVLQKYSSTSTSTSEVLEYKYEYFSPFYKSTRVWVQSTQNVLMNTYVLMNTLMSTFRC